MARGKRKRPAPVTVSYMACEGCGIPHDRSTPCSKAQVAEVVVRSAASFKKRAVVVRLPRGARSRIARGEHPFIFFPLGEPCPLEVGDVVDITSFMRIEVTKVEGSSVLEEWAVSYLVHDDRPRLLRQRTHALDFDAMKDRLAGKRDAVKDAAAAEESAYTTSPGSAMTAEPEAVPREEQEWISESARREALQEWELERATIEAAIERLRENPAVNGQESALSFLESQLDRIDKKVRRGEAKDAA